MANYLFKNDVERNTTAFDELYKTADILIASKHEAADYLKYADLDDKFNLFHLVDAVEDNGYFSNWRNFKSDYERSANNSNNDSIFKVSKKIKLYLDNTNIPTGYSYDLGKISDLTKSGAFSALQNIAEGVAQFTAALRSVKEYSNGGSGDAKIENGYQARINPLKNVPYFQNLSTSTIDSLSFTFSWGQFGLYNCELEVVKPVFALANCFGYSIDNEGYIQTPFDPKFDVVTKAYSKLFSTANKKTITDAAKNSSNSQTISGIGTLTKKLNEIYTEVAGSTSVPAALIRIGGGVFGPVYVSEVNWEFDYSQQDKYGMPYKSKVMLNGIKPLLIEDMNGFVKSGGIKLN